MERRRSFRRQSKFGGRSFLKRGSLNAFERLRAPSSRHSNCFRSPKWKGQARDRPTFYLGTCLFVFKKLGDCSCPPLWLGSHFPAWDPIKSRSSECVVVLTRLDTIGRYSSSI